MATHCRNTKLFSMLQEYKVAKSLGWETVTGSGARPCTPGDVIGENWLGECKTHTSDSKSIYFNHDVWEKIKSEAVSKHRRPVLFTDDGSQSLDTTWCVCLANSIENDNIYVTSCNMHIKKNISFDHLKQIADYRSVKRSAPDLFQHCSFVFSLTWLGDTIYLMPFESFKQIVEAQG